MSTRAPPSPAGPRACRPRAHRRRRAAAPGGGRPGAACRSGRRRARTRWCGAGRGTRPPSPPSSAPAGPSACSAPRRPCWGEAAGAGRQAQGGDPPTPRCPGTRGAGLTAGRAGPASQGRSLRVTSGCWPPPQLGGRADLPDGVRQEAQAPGQLDLLPEGEGGDGPLEGDGDGPVAQVELAEGNPAGLGGGGTVRCRWGTPGPLPRPSPRSRPGPPP